MELDLMDTRLLNIIQSNFPLTTRPYLTLAEQIGTTEADVLVRVQGLKDKGIIRRIGGIFDSRKLGYKSTLCAMPVPPDRVDEVASIINGYSGVTHNYLREDSYNLWFTLIAANQKEMDLTLEDMRRRTGIKELVSLPAIRLFKIKVDFRLKSSGSDRLDEGV